MLGELVFGQGQHFVTVGDLRRAGHHDPVLGAVVVFLQAQAGFGLDRDGLDLEAAAFVYAVVPAPGAANFAAQGLLYALLSGELIDDVFHVLAARLAAHQHGVCGLAPRRASQVNSSEFR